MDHARTSRDFIVNSGSLILFRKELIVAAGIALSAAAVGMVFVSTWGRTPHFYQEVFGPAVLWACGRGFAEPEPGQCPSLDAFLHPDVRAGHPPVAGRFDCGELPAEMRTSPLIYFQQAHRHLLFAAAIMWRMFGVAWSALVPLYGLLFGAAALALYALFRLGMRRAWAAAGVLLLAVSPVQLNNLVRLRDYAKAPFLLGALFLMALLVIRPMRRRARLALCALGGVWLGLGLGFRMDVSVAMPAFCLCILVFSPGAVRETWLERVAGVLLLCAGYAAVGAPMLLAQGGSSTYHYFLMGQAEIYDQRLGVGGAPYQAVHRYFDSESLAAVQAHALNQSGAAHHYDFFTPEYDAMGKQVVRRMLWTFPADQVTRAYAAVVRTIDELGSGAESAAPREVSNTFVKQMYALHTRAMGLLTRYARYALLASLLLLAAYNLRLGFAALFLILYFAGYGALQFASRHYFHMQFLSLWPVFFLLSAGMKHVWAARDETARQRWRESIADAPPWRWKAIHRVFVFVAVALLVIFPPLHALRWHQAQQAAKLLEQYEAAPRETVATLPEPVRDKILLSAPSLPTLPPPGARFFAFEMLVAEFDTTQGETPFMVVGDGDILETAITWGGTLPKTATGPTRVYFPAFYARWNATGDSWSRFAGIELVPEHASRLTGLYRLTEPVRLPLLLTAALSPEWREGPLWQRFVR